MKKPYKVLGKYRGYEIKQSITGKSKGLIYAENKDGGIGMLGGENSIRNVKELVDNKIKRDKK